MVKLCDALFETVAAQAATLPTLTMSAPTTALSHATSTKKRKRMPMKIKMTKLYTFPSFDKCDSLLFFPSSMARLTNSGDFKGLLKLFQTHANPNCQIQLSADCPILDITSVVKFYELVSDLHPDSMRVVRSTQQIDRTYLIAAYVDQLNMGYWRIFQLCWKMLMKMQMH